MSAALTVPKKHTAAQVQYNEPPKQEPKLLTYQLDPGTYHPNNHSVQTIYQPSNHSTSQSNQLSIPTTNQPTAPLPTINYARNHQTSNPATNQATNFPTNQLSNLPTQNSIIQTTIPTNQQIKTTTRHPTKRQSPIQLRNPASNKLINQPINQPIS